MKRPTTGHFKTPPKRKRSAIPMASSLGQPLIPKRQFKPLSRALSSPIPSSPKRKRPRTGQTTPQKTKKLPKVHVESSPACSGSISLNYEDEGGFGSAIPNHFPPFESLDSLASDLPSGEVSTPTTSLEDPPNSPFVDPSFIDDGFNLSASISELELRLAAKLPSYLQALQWNPTSLAQISERCFIVQDWDQLTKIFKVKPVCCRSL